METIPQHHKDLFLEEAILLELKPLVSLNQRRALSHLKGNRIAYMEAQHNLLQLEGYLEEEEHHQHNHPLEEVYLEELRINPNRLVVFLEAMPTLLLQLKEEACLVEANSNKTQVGFLEEANNKQ